MQANQTLAALRLPTYSEAVLVAFAAVAETDRGSPEREDVILAEDRAWRLWLRENHAAFIDEAGVKDRALLRAEGWRRALVWASGCGFDPATSHIAQNADVFTYWATTEITPLAAFPVIAYTDAERAAIGNMAFASDSSFRRIEEASRAAMASAETRAMIEFRRTQRAKTHALIKSKIHAFRRAPNTLSRFWPGAQFETPRDLLARIRFDAGAAPESDRRAALIVAWLACRAERAASLTSEAA